MASTMQQKLQFLKDYTSYASIARKYGIPYRTVLSAKNTGTIPPSYNSKFTRMWSNESYAAMRDAYVPVSQRSVLRGGSLDKVTSAITTIRNVLDRWALGATKLKFNNKVGQQLTPAQKSFYDLIKSQIGESLGKNKTTAEELYAGEQTRY